MSDGGTDLRTATTQELNDRYGQLPTTALVKLVASDFAGSIAFANSFGIEDVVLQHLLLPWLPQVAVFVLDTGRLPEETYAVIERWLKEFNLPVQMFHPEAEALSTFTQEHGPNAFYRSVQLRQQCCAVRKLAPLQRALADKDAWFTGLRRGQSAYREATAVFDRDGAGRLKVSPLAAWTDAEVWSYAHEHRLPYNALYQQGYPSIGCSPCSRAVAPGDDPRSGRWWWEDTSHKECGLHLRRDPEVHHVN